MHYLSKIFRSIYTSILSLSCSTLLCKSTLIKWWCLEERETLVHSALCIVLARSAVHKTNNTLNSCVDCSTSTSASLLTGNEHTGRPACHKMLLSKVKKKCDAILHYEPGLLVHTVVNLFLFVSILGSISTLLTWRQPMWPITAAPLAEIWLKSQPLKMIIPEFSNTS